MPSIKFLQYLNQKLKTGNLRSIHLNSLPGRYATRLDLSKLNSIQDQLAEEFLSTLLQKSNFKFNISFNNINLNEITEEQQDELNFIAKKLNGTYYQNNDHLLEHGVKTFGFGYPLLIKRSKQDPNKIIKAPLLIWHLDIKKSPQKRNVWEISKSEDSPVNLNEVLISYIKQDERITIKELPREFLEDDIIDENEIIQICNRVLEQLNVSNENNFKVHIAPCPDRKKIENITGNIPWISWTGIFGLYKAQKESIIKEMEELIDDYDLFEFENLKAEPFQESTITSVEETDPSQEQILNSLNKSLARIIQGPPGTGKSQSLTAIITNALESGAKCIVVCEKKTALNVIHNNLKELNLGNLCAVIEDVSRDRRKIIDSARAKFDEVRYRRTTFRSIEYDSNLDSYRNLIDKINKHHWSLLRSIFGDDNWKDIIGRYIEHEKKESKEKIKPFLKRSDYNYTYEEFQELLETIREGQLYYKIIKTSDHPFTILHDKIFSEPYYESIKEEIHDNLKLFYEECIELLNEYSKSLEIFGEQFNTGNIVNRIINKLLSPISKHHKNIEKKRKEFINQYRKLAFRHKANDYFPFVFKVKRGKNNFAIIYQQLNEYAQIVNNLLNEFDIFQEYYEWRSFWNSLNKKHKNIINALIKSNSSFWEDAFKSWYFNNILSKYEKKLGPFNTNNKKLEELKKLNTSLTRMQREKINNLWAQKQRKSIENFKERKGNINSLYNYRKNKKYGRKNSLRKIINVDFQLFTDLFPVLMVNPVVSSSIIPLKEGLFDIVIFDEASQLRLEDTFTSYVKGKYKIISGDEHQMPPSNYFGKEVALDEEEKEESNSLEKTDNSWDESLDNAEKESLLQYSAGLGFEKSYLDFHYRSRHPFLIDFSNAAFYGSRLTPMPEKYEYKPIRFLQVDGTYQKNRTNPEEGRYIVDILFNQIKKDKVGNYPSVGIATFNIDQRNMILEMIQDECYMDERKSNIYEKIRESGFFVKNLENIQGDEKDIIIISTTFGTNAAGKFRQNFGPINQQKGYKLFNVIITRAKRQLILCTSIPPKYYENYREEIPLKGNTGKGILYAYLAYSRSIENEDEETRQSILKILSENCSEPEVSKSERFIESPFEQEVFDYLTNYISEERIIPQYEFGGFRIDFVIKSQKSGDPFIAIECDGAQYHDSEEAYAHDMYRQKIIEKEGDFYFYRIWSTNWWPEPEKEVGKLVHYIKLKEKEIENSRKQKEYISKEKPLSHTSDSMVKVYNQPENGNDIEEKKKVVTRDSKVRVKNIHDGNIINICFTDLKQKTDLSSRSKMIISEDAPLAKAMLNKTEGEKFKLNGIEVYYEILDVEN
jgi:superfamily I DNA and/or RNA helicase/transcription elongation GreA/GreB family factor